MSAMLAPAPPSSAAPLRSFLTLDQLGPHGLRALLDLTARMKRDPGAFRNRLAGGRLGMLFDKPSTRTRVSFESAAWMLGMLPIVLRPDELQIGRGETVADTARTLSLYINVLAVRTFSQASIEELSAAASIPVINALTNEHHPCQAVADVMTLEESLGSLAGLSVAFIGDGDNVCHSLMQAAALAGFELRVATPAGYEPSADILAEAFGNYFGWEVHHHGK
jgi:ornithine carbamoyltransferase